jgi:cell fate regulator YaaT (PSP1 superfamily)
MNDHSDAPFDEAENISESFVPDTVPEAPKDEVQGEMPYPTGRTLRFIRVRFPGSNRSLQFMLEDGQDFLHGQKVVALSEDGPAVGFINSFSYEQKFHRGLMPLRTIARAASEEDVLAQREIFWQEKRLETIAYKYIERHRLDMQISSVEIGQLGKKATFSFTAPSRIDFRGLVHDMVGELKIRIELRQVTVRDRSAAVGGLGPCGRELCCSSFLSKYGNVGIKLAKNQDLSLNSSKINGVCGQLKCCLVYEDEAYVEKRKRLPRDGGLAKTKDGNQGKVIKLDILAEQFDLINPDGVIRRYTASMWDGPPEGLVMPKFFENGVNDQRKTIVGLEETLARKEEIRRGEMVESKARAKDWVDSLFTDLFGEKSLGLSLPDLEEPNNPRRAVVPEEEEELTYVPPEGEMLDDDGDEDEDDDEEGDEDHGSAADDVMAPQTLPRLEMPAAERPPLRPQQSLDIQQGHRSHERGNQRPGLRPDNRPDHAGQPPRRDDRGPRRDGRPDANRDGQRNAGARAPGGDRPAGGGSRGRRGGRGGRGRGPGGGGNGGGNGGGGGSRPPQG